MIRAQQTTNPTLNSRHNQTVTTYVKSTYRANDRSIAGQSANILFSTIVAKNCEKSFQLLYETNFNKLLYFSRKYLKSIETCEEVVNEVFMKIWNNRHSIQISSSFNSYLFTSVRNKCLDVLRKETTDTMEIDDIAKSFPSNHSDTLEVVYSNDLSNRIDKAIDQLPADRRRIFLMSRKDGLKYREIAQKLDISIKTVETQMGRSLKHLRSLFKKELQEYQ